MPTSLSFAVKLWSQYYSVHVSKQVSQLGSIDCPLFKAIRIDQMDLLFGDISRFHMSNFAVITLRLFPAIPVTYIAQLTNPSRSLDAPVPHAAKINP
jgi:hypothetical protein